MKQQEKPKFDLFNQPKGETLRDIGIKKAIDHANQVHENWGDKAFNYLKIYMQHNREFMVEDVRELAEKAIIEQPPSNRAWGAVIRRAKKEGFIYHAGYRPVKNSKAHCTPASVWRVFRHTINTSL